jgi:hypothetical protein
MKTRTDAADFLRNLIVLLLRYKKVSESRYGLVNGFPKATKIDNFCRFFITVCSGFQKPWLLAAVGNPFMTCGGQR